jgi:LysM repeat protein
VVNNSSLSPAAIPTITATEIPISGTYTVQPGDYLARLAREWGVNWQDVAQINGIPFPFQLVTGQVLKIPVKK